MAKKTNRTSHVMDLLTNGASGDAPEVTTEASGQEKKSDVQSLAATPAKVTVVDEGSINDRVSQEILGKLTEELESETGTPSSETTESSQETAGGQAEAAEVSQDKDTVPPAEEPQAPAAPQEDSSQEAPIPASDSQEAVLEPAVEESPADTIPEASQASQEVSQPAVPQESPAPKPSKKEDPHSIIPESHFSSHTKNREYRFVNVMEELLMRQDLDAVLQQHNVCTCPRCMSDVCALALTGLPSKYVVTSKDSISPLLSYYENKYKIPILTELMKACNKVRENPRHRKS